MEALYRDKTLQVKPETAPAVRGTRSWDVQSRGNSWEAKWERVRAIQELIELNDEAEIPLMVSEEPKNHI